MTKDEAKAIAAMIVAEMPERCSIGVMAEIVEKLNLTIVPPPPEGAVEVRIAVGINKYGPFTFVEGEVSGAIESYWEGDETHRCIVEAYVPPIVTPVVKGTVTQ